MLISCVFHKPNISGLRLWSVRVFLYIRPRLAFSLWRKSLKSPSFESLCDFSHFPTTAAAEGCWRQSPPSQRESAASAIPRAEGQPRFWTCGSRGATVPRFPPSLGQIPHENRNIFFLQCKSPPPNYQGLWAKTVGNASKDLSNWNLIQHASQTVSYSLSCLFMRSLWKLKSNNYDLNIVYMCCKRVQGKIH